MKYLKKTDDYESLGQISNDCVVWETASDKVYIIRNLLTTEKLCQLGYGVETDYGYNLKGNFVEEGVPIPVDLKERVAGDDGKQLKVAGLLADDAFWEEYRNVLKNTVINSDNLVQYFNGSNLGGEVETTFKGGEYMTMSYFGNQTMTKLTLHLEEGFISVCNNAFTWHNNLKEFITDAAYGTNDLTAMFDHCTALVNFTPPTQGWNHGGLDNRYDQLISQANSTFQNCTSIKTIPQYGDVREADVNTFTPATAQNFMYNTYVTTLGPVIDMRYIDPANKSQCNYIFWDSLVDARIKNLNHGDWYFNWGTSDTGVIHGSFTNFNQESIEYLINNLWDLTTEHIGYNVMSYATSFKLWHVDSPAKVDDNNEGVVIIPTRSKSGAQVAYVWASTSLTDWKIKVSGLQNGDKLEIGNVGTVPSDKAITEDGEYTVSWSGNGYIVNFNDEEVQPTGDVKIEILENVYHPQNHLVSNATLHVTESWRSKLTSDLILAAKNKGWSIQIGDEILS